MDSEITGSSMIGVSIILPTYRNPEYLDICLRSLTENQKNEIIVVVDGFLELSESVLTKYPGINVITLQNNMGMQHAINIGVMQATSKYVCVANDDNVFPENFDARLKQEIVKCESQYGDKFVLTINQVEPTGPGMFNHAVEDFGRTASSFRYDDWMKDELLISKPDQNENGHIFPFVVAKKYYLAVGGLDTFYDSPNVCDWDLFLKWELLNFHFPRTHALHLYHFGSVTTRSGPDASLFRNREIEALQTYEYKWGAKPYNEPITNSKIPPDKMFRGFFYE